ncbi:MAG: glycosyltransferase, partial [Alishewanella aestuarii]
MKLANENWFLSKYLLNKYSKYKKKDILIYSSSVKKKEIGEPKKIDIQGEIVLLFVGRLEKEKRPEVALLTFKKLRELGYKCSLKIVGDGSLRKQLEELAKSLEIKNCTFLGWIKDRSALMDIYNGSHILLLPS